jgi:hypothetical protein
MSIGMGITSLEGQWPYNVTWSRIWDIGCHWGAINTAKGVYDWTKLDAVVDRMIGQGMRIIYTIGGAPQWNSSNPNSTTYAPWLGKGSNGLPADQNEFNAFCYALVTRYKGWISAYEMWNEPQLIEFLDPYTPANTDILAQMTKRFYTNAKLWDPDCLVLGAPILPRPTSGGMKKATTYLTSMQTKGWNVDYMTCHIYPKTGEGDQWTPYLNDVRAKLVEMGAPKPRVPWVTETMFNLLGDDPGDAAIAAWTKAAYDGAKTAGVSVIVWYAWNRPDLKGPWIFTGTQQWDDIQRYGPTLAEFDDDLSFIDDAWAAVVEWAQDAWSATGRWLRRIF